MRTLAIASLLVSLLFVGCSSSGSGSGSGSSSSNGSGKSDLKASDVKPVKEPTHVAWVSFKDVNPRTGKRVTNELNLINKTHPAASKPIPLDRMMKVLTAEQMGLLVKELERRKFFKYARQGVTPDRVPSTRGNGIIVVNRGGKTLGLVFEKGQDATRSEVPLVYTECKKVIVAIFNSADQFQVYTSDSERVREIDPRLPSDGINR